MNRLEYYKATPLSLKADKEFDEEWLKQRIIDDPNLLGLGDLELKATEKIQPKAGRLDLLFQEIDDDKRYTVELMLGKIDESHIIRTIEYWDIERKRLPNYEYAAVIVAEDITTRFLNVISLFNNTIPIIALQVNAYEVDGKIILAFTKILDEFIIGEDEQAVNVQPADEQYWITRTSKKTMATIDGLIKIVKEFAPEYSINFTKSYVSLNKNERPNNFAVFRPKSTFIRAEIKLNDLEYWANNLKNESIEVISLDKNQSRLKFRVTDKELKTKSEILHDIMKASFDEWKEW